MPDILAAVQFTAKSGQPRDNVVTNFAFSMPAGWGGDADLTALKDEIEGLYDGLASGQQNALSAYLGNSLVRTADGVVIDVYDITGHLDGSPHGSPIGSRAFTLGASLGTGDLPREVQLCVTLRGIGWATALVEVPDGADPGTAVDRPKQRHSGRHYFGPLSAGNAVAAADAVTGDVRPGATFRADVLAAYKDFAEDVKDMWAGARFGVWSRRMEFIHTVEAIQVDDAFDIQRRRGSSPSVRSTTTVTLP